MKALQAKVLPITNTKPSRIKVSAMDNKPVIYSTSQFNNPLYDPMHEAMLKYMIEQMKWNNYELVTGYLSNNLMVGTIINKRN